jgi:NAD(P)-dependent dehydrogenase (short-subunit alcohol dehydrogenase family)/acyl carrier protein
VDVVLSSLAGEALVRSFEVLGDYGRFLEIGKRDIYANSRLELRPFRKNLSFHAIDLDRMIRERPALLGKMLRQLAEEARAGRVPPLPVRVFAIADVTEAFRLMQQTRHIGKIVLSLREPPSKVAASEEPIELDPEAAYLVTGGLGGFGMAVARWLVERGARHLVLLGRRGIGSPEVRERVSALEKLGAEILVERADVTREEDVARVLAGIEERGRVLRGIVHAAMVLEDSLLLNLDRERMRRVLAPKLNGAWNLHRLTQDCPLDFFVMFSSLSSVFGHAGQGSYAAANLFLDALAWYRRARGLPALTVNWGYLAEVGYLAERPQLGERLERQGVQSFTVRQALTLLALALQRQAIQISVMKVDWSRWRGLGVTGRVSPRFAHLLRRHEAAGQTSAAGLPTIDAVRAAAPEARHGLLDTLLRDKLARVLGAAPDRIDPDKPLLNLGLDSLMAIELRNWIEQELHVNLPIMQLMRSSSLAGLTDHLLELLVGLEGEGQPAVGREASLAHEDPERLLEKIEELAGEDVDALLTTLFAEKQQDRSATS